MKKACLAVVSFAAVGCWLVVAASAMAADHTVNCAANPSAMTSAITNANAGDRLLVNGTCVGAYRINENLIVRGNPRATFDGNQLGPVFIVYKTLKLVRVTVTGGSFSVGGGVFSESRSHVVLDHVTVRGNHADSGGGGLDIGGTLRMRGSTVSGNTSGFLGGGISAGDGSLLAKRMLVTITNSTISGNRARTAGGGVWLNGIPFRIRQTTISDNTASSPFSEGGGLEFVSVRSGVAPRVVTGSIISGNHAAQGADCLQPYTSGGWNVAGASCGFANTGDVTTTTPSLGPLGWNGGSTKTMPLLGDSPAIDLIPVGATAPGGLRLCPGVDQRGVTRPQGTRCDAGAYELAR